MPAIDVFKKGEADGKLVKYSVKADPRDEDAFTFEADVAFSISGPEDAKILEQDIPGAVDMWTQANNPDTNWKIALTVKPNLSVSAELSNAVKGLSAIKGLAEVKSLTLRASKKAVTTIVKLVWGGQPAETATSLARLLRNATTLSLEPQQQELPYRKPGEVLAFDEGDIIVARLDDGEEVCGFVADGGDTEEVDGEDSATIDDCGKEHVVPTRSFVSVVKVELVDDAVIPAYVKRAKKAKVKASTRAILAGLLQGGTPDGRIYTINEATIDAALEWDGKSGDEARGNA